MKKSHYIFFGALIALVVFLNYDLNKRIDVVKNSRKTMDAMASVKTEVDKVAAVKTGKIEDEPVTAVQIAAEPKDLFARKFKQEALELAKLQEDSEEAQKRLKQLAQQMKPGDVEGLFEVISNDKNNGDTRALAVELLSIKNDTASLMALQNFVGNNKNANGQKWDRRKEFESVLRAQAVEGIAGYPEKAIAISTLSFLKKKVDDKFLSDRIGRASANLISNAGSAQQQDEEALKKLVE